MVAEEIRGMIMRGDLAPGDRLRETQIAESLGVSRNPVREAIRVLETTGLIEVKARIGASVAKFDVDDLRQLLAVRSLLEAFAASLASAHRSAEDLSEITRCIADGRAASEANDQLEAARHHRDYHRAIEQASGNPHLAGVVRPLRQQTELVFSVLADNRGKLTWDEHELVLDAIERCDAEAARKHVTDHLNSVIDGLPRGQR